MIGSQTQQPDRAFLEPCRPLYIHCQQRAIIVKDTYHAAQGPAMSRYLASASDVLCGSAEYVKRFAKKADAEEPSAKEGSDGTGSDGFLSSSDDEEDLPASGGGGGMMT